MNFVDIIAIVIIALGALAGFKRGAIKSLVQLIGIVAIVIVAYQFKGLLGNVFIKYLPFFNFGGVLNELFSINILIYQGIAFVIMFVLLYCILNILINLSGIIDLLIKFTVILELPSKIIGTILGAIESLVFVFVLGFVLLQIAPAQKYIMDSKIMLPIVERTPVVRDVFYRTNAAAVDMYRTVEKYQTSGNALEANLEILRSLVVAGVVDAGVVQDCIDNGKLHMDNVVFSSGVARP